MTGLELVAEHLHWMDFAVDDRDDQCAHGDIRVVVGGQTLTTGNDVTVSAAGLYLLRTLRGDHIRGSCDVTGGKRLFPHCGFTVIPGEPSCEIIGCNSGADMSVETRGTEVCLGGRRRTVKVDRADWVDAVLRFTRTVEEFYSSQRARSEPETQEEALGWHQFWDEWHQLVAFTSCR